MRTAAPKYIRERRLADPLWVARHKRSLGRNRQFRACVRMEHELRKEMAKLNKNAEAAQASSAATITRKVNEFLQRVARLFTRRSAKS
jgi:aminoglycoside phosphotransferase family enzyme